MIRVAIVEDDAGYSKELAGYLKQYEKDSGESIVCTVFTDGDEIVEGYEASFDIILMDIEMRFMDGMTAAEKIREMDGEVVIIFITNMPQYAMKGYTVDALDYVLKPLSYFAFSQRIDRALTRMKRREERFVTIPIRGGFKKLPVTELCFIEVQDHDLIYYTRTSSYMTKGSMKSLEETLAQDHFFRCNKCYLINLMHVDGVVNNDVTVGGKIVQVSRSKKKALLDAINDYINEVGK